MSLIKFAKRLIANSFVSDKDLKKDAVKAYQAMSEESKENTMEVINSMKESNGFLSKTWEIVAFSAVINKEYDALDIVSSRGANLDSIIAEAVVRNDGKAMKILLDNGANPSARVDGYIDSGIFGDEKMLDFPLLAYVVAGPRNLGGSSDKEEMSKMVCDLLDAGESENSLASTTISTKRSLSLLLCETFKTFSPVSSEEYNIASSMRSSSSDSSFYFLEDARMQISSEEINKEKEIQSDIQDVTQEMNF